MQQYFQSNCRADDGRLIIPTSLTSLYIRLNASGDFGDTWYAQNVKAHIQAVDATFPKLYNNSTAGIAVVPGPYYKGGRFYVSVPFNEIVYAAGSPKRLLTTWGAASYEAGDGSNVITFKGTISADPGTQLAITNCACNFRDIANNHFQGSVNKTFSGAVVEIIPWDGYGTAAAPYVIASTNQLNLLAARVNAGESFANTYFTLGTDIAYSRPVSSTWSNPGAVNNYTPIGGVGTGFRGIFDGKGYTVSGIRIYKTGTGNADSRLGLFSSNEGTVRNVVLADTAITGYESCGGIAGYNSGTVENCRVKNNVGISGATSGAIVGSVSGSAALAANYYRGCTVNGVADNVGTSSGDVPGARGLYTLALADGISVVSAETVPITNVTYYAANTPVLIACTPPAGYALLTCALNGTPLTGDTFTMPFADSSVSVSWYPTFNGSGTQDDPYLISTKGDLDNLAANVNNGITNYAGAYFLQTADIAYSGNKNNYTPVGTNANSSFSGIYDGGGRVVSGLIVQRKNYLGLFGSVTNGIVRNVSIVDCSFSGENYAGGIVGLLADGIVSNCCAGSGVFVKDSTSAWCHGGIVGKNDSGTVVGCLSAASVTYISGWSGVRRRGGVVGLLSRGGSVKDCLYVGDAVEGAADVFGIVELGAIAGVADYGCSLANNYYTSDSVPGGVESHDRNGARRARTLTLGADIALVAGGETVYDVSGLAAIGTNVLRSVSGEGGTNLYSGAEQTISFTYTGTVPPGHVLIVSYNDGADHVLEPANGVYSFVMPDADVTITTTSIIPWSGSGTAADPYLISTTNDLNWLAMFVNDGVNYSGTNFLQTADLPYDGTLNNYTPVGTNGNHSFHGTYDGGGHVVSGIAVDGGTERFLGLFGYVMNGTVRNVVLADSSISGSDNVGGIVGKLIDGVVSNCCVGSGVAVIAGGAGAWWHGGVAGVNHSGTIVGCLSAASVTTNGYGECTCYGGIVGKAVYGSVKDCLSVGDVVEGASYVGAIVGCADDCTLVDNYYIRADMPGGVNGNDVPGEAERAYAFIAGPGVTLAAADAAVADYPVSGIALYDGYLFWGGRFYAPADAGVALTLGYAVAEGYTLDGGYAVSAGTIAGSTLTVAAMPAAAVTVHANVTAIPWTGSGTEEDPYVILYPSQLDLLATRVNGGTSYLGKYFKLGADIAYDPTALDENGENYTAIGGNSRHFCGNFDGAGHTVSGIRINKTGNDDASNNQGLFGYCNRGTLQNITLADSVIVGNDYVGGIAGECINCVILACRAESSVIIKAGCDDADSHGGIVGHNFSRSTYGCMSAATVTDNGKAECSYYGGIVGDPGLDTVKDCLAIGSVVTSYNYGGAIAGRMYSPTLTNNYYAACAVNGRATNVGCNGSDIDGARRAHTVTLGEWVALAGAETVYSNSCLTAIGTSALRYTGGGTNVIYGGAGQTLTLTGDVDGYAVTKDADGTDVTDSTFNSQLATLTMPDYDITVAAYFLPGWERLQAAIDAAEDGATIVLTRDYVYTSGNDGGNTRWVGGAGSGSAGSEPGSIVYPAGDPLTISGGKSITIDLNGHTIDGNGGSSVFHVGGGGALTLTNSIPESGAVTNGYAGSGGGVYVEDYGMFTMTGGAISGNSAESDGAGVYVSRHGTFTMTGGAISGNNTNRGGGVYVFFGTFMMSGGTISGNCGEYGGGVLVDDGAFAVSGNPVISGNTNDVEDVSNVYLNENLTIAVSNLTAGAFLGVTTYPEPEEGSPVTITTGAVLGDVQYFFSDDPNCSVGTATNGEVYSCTAWRTRHT